MVCPRYLRTVVIAVCAGVIGAHAFAGEVVSAPPVSRGQVVLAASTRAR